MATRPLEAQRVRILSWHLLYGRSMPLVGREGWQRMEAQVEVPDFKGMEPNASCAMGPFIQALKFIAGELGQGEDFIRTLAHNSVQGWASQNEPLVQQLRGQPRQMLELFFTQVYPWFVDDAGACQILESESDHFVFTLDTDMVRAFEVGLVEAYCQLAGASARISELEPKRYRVTWTTG